MGYEGRHGHRRPKGIWHRKNYVWGIIISHLLKERDIEKRDVWRAMVVYILKGDGIEKK